MKMDKNDLQNTKQKTIIDQHKPHKKQVYKILYTKLKLEQHEPHKKTGVQNTIQKTKV
jgi:hypothetical protein